LTSNGLQSGDANQTHGDSSQPACLLGIKIHLAWSLKTLKSTSVSKSEKHKEKVMTSDASQEKSQPDGQSQSQSQGASSQSPDMRKEGVRAAQEEHSRNEGETVVLEFTRVA